MKFISTQSNLAKGVSIAEKVIGKNFNLPILQNIKIKCEDAKSSIKLLATDLDIGIEVEIPGRIEKSGSITVPARLFSNFIKALPEENVEVLESNKSIVVACGKHKSTIKGESDADFPILPSIKNGLVIELKTSDFILGINSVIYCVSNLDIKPEISGVLVQFIGSDLCFTATDSFRLSEKRIDKSLKNSVNHKIILPKKTCDLICRVFNNNEELVFNIGEGQICIKNKTKNQNYPKITMISRVIDGDYPDYEQIIPKNFSIAFEISKEELVNHIRTAGLFSSKINEIALNILPSKQNIEILSKDYDYGDHYSLIPCVINGSEDLKISFNYNYLLDGLQIIDCPSVNIKLNKDSTPILVSSGESDGFRYIVMPIRS
ncbi:MAG: DNA polymerase III subunit beta [Candidatus Spechtbacteria bacterium RIFCSPHIGHO2_02_FULL_43_15b]|uniref:Beta sliding clamp n=1 Tax=Candidatus Spechtbacteria bacterium RIFCSPHIGHO2_01_FULL_43_30 TaxID=1802158 RepID=A0A1G2H715_9BACT|nr:MAG: DNA polymerase III subunit beta [Candidatus Spechtbacteria bacterium RIFCSPHIGHO2_01_FULL_43_30]OGZ60169.1 MAG: DNA polymerase III subunit beta [Candidatus Spechtbacteria bacterium RIFCSPHIGHO2_02_FULL_43_15b]